MNVKHIFGAVVFAIVAGVVVPSFAADHREAPLFEEDISAGKVGASPPNTTPAGKVGASPPNTTPAGVVGASPPNSNPGGAVGIFPSRNLPAPARVPTSTR